MNATLETGEDYLDECMSVTGVMPDRKRIDMYWFLGNMNYLLRKYGRDVIDWMLPTLDDGFKQKDIDKYHSMNVKFFDQGDEEGTVKRIKEFREHANIGYIVSHRKEYIYTLSMEFWDTMSIQEKSEMVRVAPESWIIAYADQLTFDMNLIGSISIQESLTLLARFDHLIDWRGGYISSLVCVNHEYIRRIHDRFDWKVLSYRIIAVISIYDIIYYEAFAQSFSEDLTKECLLKIEQTRVYADSFLVQRE